MKITTEASHVSRERVFYDIAHVLESTEGSEERVIRVLELLRALLPYEQSALLEEAAPGRAPRLFTVPGTPPEVRAHLERTLTTMLANLAEERARPAGSASAQDASHLAVPIVGRGRVIGLIIVSHPGATYDERDLRALSVVAANLGAHLTMVRVLAEEADRMRQLDEALLAAEAASRVRDEFLALISHELKMPLASTLAGVRLLSSSTQLGEELREHAIQAIERNLDAQAKLIEQMLELTCIAATELRLHPRTVNPETLIKSVVEGWELRAKDRSIHIDCTLDGSIQELVVDPDRFRQVVSSVLENAIKFTPDQGRVEVRLVRSGARACIQVIDSGKGISEKFLPHVFERFRQEESVTTRKHRGLGVGLAIVKSLVERQGGAIRAESPGDGKGATFTIELPLEAARTGAALEGIHVLVVDDDDDVRFAFQAVLERHGARVTAVVSAAEALAALEEGVPDVLLSDLAMPGGSGYELMEKVALIDAAPPAAAIITHGQSDEDRERALAAGFRLQVEKPVTADALVAIVLELARGVPRFGDDAQREARPAAANQQR